MAKTGRPTKYSDELADAFCRHISEGGTAKQFCDQPGMPSRDSIYRWILEKPYFSDLYAKARLARADTWFDRVIEVASDRDRDPGCRRVEADALKWAAAKQNPKVYGDVKNQPEDNKEIKIVIEHKDESK